MDHTCIELVLVVYQMKAMVLSYKMLCKLQLQGYLIRNEREMKMGSALVRFCSRFSAMLKWNILSLRSLLWLLKSSVLFSPLPSSFLFPFSFHFYRILLQRYSVIYHISSTCRKLVKSALITSKNISWTI